MKKAAVITASLAILLACQGPKTPGPLELFDNRDDICVVVGSKDMIDFGTEAPQYSYNPVKHIFRAGLPIIKKDSITNADIELVEQYFVLVLDAEPSSNGSAVNGTLSLKSNTIKSGFRTYTVQMQVRKRSENLVWLWDDTKKIGVISKIGQ